MYSRSRLDCGQSRERVFRRPGKCCRPLLKLFTPGMRVFSHSVDFLNSCVSFGSMCLVPYSHSSPSDLLGQFSVTEFMVGVLSLSHCISHLHGLEYRVHSGLVRLDDSLQKVFIQSYNASKAITHLNKLAPQRCLLESGRRW